MKNRKPLVIIAAAVTAVVLLLTAVKSTRALNGTIQRLAHAESSLRSSDVHVAKTISQAFERSEELILILARQSQPRTEWTYLLTQLKGTFTEFLEQRRYESVLPRETATARYYLARLLFLQGNQKAARDSIGRCVALAGSINDQVLVAEAKNTLACLAAANGEYSLAQAVLVENCAVLNQMQGQENLLAITLRNRGLIERARGGDGTETLRKAIAILERSPDSQSFGLTSELLQDFRMTLCEIYWSQGRIDEAARLARQAHVELQNRFLGIELPNEIDKHLIARNRYVNALRFVERDLLALHEAQRAAQLQPPSREALGETANRWQWHPLVDLTTDLVSNHLSVTGTMVGEFEPQTGLVLTWGTLDWTHSVTMEIAKNVHDRTQLVILSDTDESLDEAQTALEDAGVPLNRVRFGVSDCEAPWFRDQGPIVSRSSSGCAIWFDSMLTRDDRNGRVVLDALPTVLRRNWKTRVADVPIHLEGGMLLSNGKGLTVGASAIVTLNRQYGFADETILRDLTRVTGAKNLLIVDTLIGEPTQHIDMFMAFVSPTTVVVGEYADHTDPNAALLDHTAELLRKVTVDGKPLEVVRLPMPDCERRLFPSYTNIVFANGVLLVPSYAGEEKETELKVKRIYNSLLPNWDVRFVDCTRLRRRGGALHCLVSNLGDTPYSPLFRESEKASPEVLSETILKHATLGLESN